MFFQAAVYLYDEDTESEVPKGFYRNKRQQLCAWFACASSLALKRKGNDKLSPQ